MPHRVRGVEPSFTGPVFGMARNVALAASLTMSFSATHAMACIDDGSAMTAEIAMDASAATIEELVTTAESSLALGRSQPALRDLETAVILASSLEEPRLKALTLGALGNGLITGTGRASALAIQCLGDSLLIAEQYDFDGLEVLALLNLGNGFAYRSDRKAIATYERAATLASGSGLSDLAAKSWLNRAHFRLKIMDDLAGAEDDLLKAEVIANALASSEQRAALFLAIAHRWIDLASKQTEDEGAAGSAHQALSRALELAELNGLHGIEANALGNLGRLYQMAGRLDDAETLFRRAETRARTVNDPATGYVWSWELARLLLADGRRGEALDLYRRTIGMVQAIRSSTALVPRKGLFGRSVLDDAQDVLAEYIDLEFGGDNVTTTEEELAGIQKIVEQQRQVDVESYFRDDCIADLQARIIEDVQLSPTSGLAFIYPIVLERRLVLLVSVADSIKRYIVPISRSALKDEVRELRLALMARDDSYLEPARSLYRNLVAPLEADWNEAKADNDGIHTLVIIPDGPIRGVPFAALHDGEQFLIQRYAIGIVPGLSLLKSPAPSVGQSRALLGGLTEEIEGYPPLPAVDEELRRVSEFEDAETILKGGDFTEARFARSLVETPFTGVHIASHAEFGRDAEDTFILTQDGRVDLDQLEELLKPSAFRDRPVELLTLSACNTATGDGQELSALGLAGVAVKAGARSALGTLWTVADESSPLLMDAFYGGLRRDRLSKVAALQQAQRFMLESRNEFNHPYYWAPYLLIGNWD